MSNPGTYREGGHSVIAEKDAVVLEGDLDANLLDEFMSEGRHGGVAVDIETTGLSLVESKVQVVSFATSERTAVVALKENQTPTRACSLLENRDILKIFHHALFDLAFMKRSWQVVVEPVFCTKVAARLAGIDSNPTLEMLVSKLLRAKLDKQEQRSNWAVRPLTPSQVQYAAADVAYLHSLRTELVRRVTDVGRWTIFESCMRFLDTRAELALLGLDDVFAYTISPPSTTGAPNGVATPAQ
jgi:ribonuclease D